MNNSKKPSEPVEEERWVKIEKEVQELKRSRSILSIGLFLLSGLYGILILCIILRIIRIRGHFDLDHPIQRSGWRASFKASADRSFVSSTILKCSSVRCLKFSDLSASSRCISSISC